MADRVVVIEMNVTADTITNMNGAPVNISALNLVAGDPITYCITGDIGGRVQLFAICGAGKGIDYELNGTGIPLQAKEVPMVNVQGKLPLFMRFFGPRKPTK